MGFHGTIAEHKGLHVLVDAFRRLPESAGATLRICGGIGDFPDYTAAVLEAIDRDPRINLAGRIPQEQMARELEQIDVLVVPSIWYENAPLVVYSAFAAGVPVVATDLGGMSEVVVDGQNGLLFAPADAAGLAAQLLRLAAEPGLLDTAGARHDRAPVGRRGRRRAARALRRAGRPKPHAGLILTRSDRARNRARSGNPRRPP